MAYTCHLKGLDEDKNVLCIIYQDHQRCAIVLDHSIVFKGKPPTYGFTTPKMEQYLSSI